MGIIRYGKTAQIGVYPGNQSGRFISYRKTGVPFPLDPDVQVAWPFYETGSLTDIRRKLTLGFSRASVGTYFDSSGALQTAAIDEPRFDHDPNTLAPLGLLKEIERTNLFLNSAAPVTQDVTTVADTYTVSVIGTGTVTLSGTGVGVASEGSPLTVACSAGTLTCTVAGGPSYVQVELGISTSSMIITAGSPVTRAQDFCDTADTSWYNAPEGTFYVRAITNDFEIDRALCVIATATGSNQWRILSRSNGAAQAVHSTTVGDQGLTQQNGVLTQGVEYKMASAFATDDMIIYTDGAQGPLDVTCDPMAILPTEFLVGLRENGTAAFHGWIAELGYADTRKDNAFLASLTTP